MKCELKKDGKLGYKLRLFAESKEENTIIDEIWDGDLKLQASEYKFNSGITNLAELEIGILTPEGERLYLEE